VVHSRATASTSSTMASCTEFGGVFDPSLLALAFIGCCLRDDDAEQHVRQEEEHQGDVVPLCGAQNIQHGMHVPCAATVLFHTAHCTSECSMLHCTHTCMHAGS
jgi:hypothetical protein